MAWKSKKQTHFPIYKIKQDTLQFCLTDGRAFTFNLTIQDSILSISLQNTR